MNREIDVLVCTPIHRKGAYVLDKFLSNQRDIQERYPSSGLVLATNESDFVEEMEGLLLSQGLSGVALLYKTVKPDYARSRVWNIACGRDALRKYMLSQTGARYMLCLDADTTYDPHVIGIMLEKIKGYSVAQSGCALRTAGIGLSGTACTLFTRDILERLEFRCLEFKNGQVMPEDMMLELDLYRLRGRIKKGFFLSNSHYRNATEARCITPRPVGVPRWIANASLVRYMLIRTSILIGCNIPWTLKLFVNRLPRSRRRHAAVS